MASVSAEMAFVNPKGIPQGRYEFECPVCGEITWAYDHIDAVWCQGEQVESRFEGGQIVSIGKHEWTQMNRLEKR